MTEQSPNETTLVFDVERYADYEPFERVAEAVIQQDNRRVEYIYDISHEDEQAVLQVSARYYEGGEQINQSNVTQEYETDGDVVFHAGERDLQEFIKANAFADPEVTIGEEFESYA